MKKDRKGTIVRRIENKRTERVGTVRLDKSDMTFFARDPDIDETPETRGQIEYYESKDGADVGRWVTARIAKPMRLGKPLTWLPVIEVKIDADFERGSRRSETEERSTHVRAEIDRYYVALTNDRTEWLKLAWHEVDPESASALAEEDRLAAASPYAHGPKWVQPGGGNRSRHRYYERSSVFALPLLDGDESVVAYTPELWAGLSQIFDNLDKTASTIQSMLGTKKGLALITELGAGAKQLAAGSMTPS